MFVSFTKNVIYVLLALLMAITLLYQVGTSLGARRGLLIRGGDILERVSSIDTIVFDKTGTLTVGRPVVKSVMDDQGSPKWTEKDLLTLAAGVERTASHPVARALVQAATNAGCRQAVVCAHPVPYM
jgi:Cu+-exporting ATPase